MADGAVKDEKKKGGKVVLAICVVVIVALCILIYFLLHKDDGPKRDVVVNEDNVGDILTELEDGPAASTYQVVMNSTWHFKDGKASSDNAYVENSNANKNPVYFEVTRSDTDETIFESPIIPVGSHMEKITLDKKLSAGTHDCVVTYHLLDDDEETISTVRVALTIIVDE